MLLFLYLKSIPSLSILAILPTWACSRSGEGGCKLPGGDAVEGEPRGGAPAMPLHSCTAMAVNYAYTILRSTTLPLDPYDTTESHSSRGKYSKQPF